MDVSKMNGLQIMQAFADGKLAKPSIADTMPMEINSVSSGKVHFVVQANKNHINPLGGVHGGFAATVIDSVTGCALHTLLDAGVGYSTIDLNIKMSKPIPLGRKLNAYGKIINQSSKLAISEGKITDDDDNLYAYGTAVLMLHKPDKD